MRHSFSRLAGRVCFCSLNLCIVATETKIYNLRIVPPSPVYEEIEDFKRQFEKLFGKQKYSRSKPHITLAHFSMLPGQEDRLIRKLTKLSGLKRFELDIAGFDIFEASKVLLLRVPLNEELTLLQQGLQLLWQHDLGRSQISRELPHTPHITISSAKSTEMLHRGLRHFRPINYRRRIEVDHIRLFSRDPGQTWDWEHRFPLS